MAALRGLACAGLTIVASAGAAAEGVKTRVLDVGLQGRIAVGVPTTVRVEVSSEARVSGAFHGRLVRPRQGRPDEETFGMASTEVRFLLEAGESRVLTAYLPDVTDQSCQATQLRWTVATSDGHRLAEGLKPVVCLDSRFSSTRELYISMEVLPSQRRPSEAPDDVQSYAGYDRCLITGRDFSHLREEQREALLDRAALGGVLVLAAPLNAEPGSASERLVSQADLLWRDDSGHELRELPRHLGFVRSIDRPLASLVAESRSGSPLYRLLSFKGAVNPAPDRDAFRELPRSWESGWWPSPPAENTVGRLGTATAFAILAIFAVGLHWISRPRAATPARVVLVVAFLLVLLPGFVYVAASTIRAGNKDQCASLVMHDGAGALHSAWTFASLGGGGGREDPALSFAFGPRLTWSAVRQAAREASLRVVADVDGRVRVEPERRGLGTDRLITVTLGQLQPADPAWDIEVTSTGEGTVRSLRARRPFARVGFVGPNGLVWTGSLRRGERIELAGLRWPERPTVPLEDTPIERAARLLFFRSRPAGSRGLPAYVVAAEAASCAVAADSGGNLDVRPTIHVQPLSGGDPIGWLPAERDGSLLRVEVPNAMLERMRALGRELLPQVSLLEATIRPSVSKSAAEGFHQVVFHVSGAPRMEDAVLARWPTTAREEGPR